MAKKKRATIRQKGAFERMLKAIEVGENITLKEIMLESGYSEATAINPSKNLIDKDGFQNLLAKIDDSVILGKFYEILLSDDKRSSLSAGIELLKLKDRFPMNQTKILGLFEKIDSVMEDDDEVGTYENIPEKKETTIDQCFPNSITANLLKQQEEKNRN